MAAKVTGGMVVAEGSSVEVFVTLGITGRVTLGVIPEGVNVTLGAVSCTNGAVALACSVGLAVATVFGVLTLTDSWQACKEIDSRLKAVTSLLMNFTFFCGRNMRIPSHLFIAI